MIVQNFGSCESLYSSDACRFEDYSRYHAGMLDEKHTLSRREERFPIEKKFPLNWEKDLSHNPSFSEKMRRSPAFEMKIPRELSWTDAGCGRLVRAKTPENRKAARTLSYGILAVETFLARFERAAFRLGGERSILLSYRNLRYCCCAAAVSVNEKEKTARTLPGKPFLFPSQ